MEIKYKLKVPLKAAFESHGVVVLLESSKQKVQQYRRSLPNCVLWYARH